MNFKHYFLPSISLKRLLNSDLQVGSAVFKWIYVYSKPNTFFTEQTIPVIDLTTETPTVTEVVDTDTVTTESEMETTFFSRPSPRLVTLTSTMAPETTTVVIDFTAGEEKVTTTPTVEETESSTEGKIFLRFSTFNFFLLIFWKIGIISKN